MTEHPHDRPASGPGTVRTEALVLAGHGSQHHPGTATPLHAHADRIRARGGFDEVRTAFWKEEPPLSSVRSLVESDLAVVVPVLTSEGYFADEVFPRELDVGAVDAGEVDAPAASDGPEVRYADPVGTHESVTSVVDARVASVTTGPPEEVGLALVGHGTERSEQSARATLQHATTLRGTGRYAEVAALFLDEDPRVGDLYGRLDADELVVVPFFVADGHHVTEDVPEAIDHPGVGESAEVHGRLVHYTGAIGTEPTLADVIVDRALEAGADPGGDANAPHRSPAGEAFLAWLHASTPEWTWGELSIDVARAGYELRNRRDTDASRDALERIADTAALRARVRHDDHARYRPLSGACSLPSGWIIDGLDADGILRAIRGVYPASIVHWHRERRGTLDVTHFRATAARLRGDYADLDGIGELELAAATEAVCGDCVRQRCWEASPDDAIDAGPGGGAIPCPEACPFFRAAARAFRESGGRAPPRSDPAIPPGALEDPANEYRVRHARSLSRHAERAPASLPSGGDD